MRLPQQLRKRKTDTHKGDYGHVLLIGGSVGLTGAICLAAQAALRSGCGLVTAAVPSSLNSIFETKLTEVMTLPLADSKGFLGLGGFMTIKKNLGKIDAIVLGPGASMNRATQGLMVKIASEIDKPMVVDADALNALSGNLGALKRRKTQNLVLTPHIGEFSRLVKRPKEDIKNFRKELVKDFALRYNLTLVLKGHQTLISDGKKLFENKSGNPGMATAGTGDVLSGIIASFIVQGVDTTEAARLGVYIHGLAADYASRDLTPNCIVASDVIKYLPLAFKYLLKR